MWPFRRRRPEPSGSVVVGAASADAADYGVWIVSEHRHPETYAALWAAATEAERAGRSARRTAALVPVRDPRFGVADVEVRFDGMLAGYLRPPHLGRVAQAIDAAHAVEALAPALVEWGPAGPTTRLLLDGLPAPA